jgi:hypothetical protein
MTPPDSLCQLRDVTSSGTGVDSPLRTFLAWLRRAAPWTRWEWFVLLIWVSVESVICVRSWIRPDIHCVYPIFDLAGRHWREGSPLYFVAAPGIDIFRYSPLMASFFALLSLVPLAMAGVIWRLLNVFVYLAGLCWWLGVIVPEPFTRQQRTIFFLLLLPLSLASLNNGQANLLMVGLMLLTVAAVRLRWFTVAGFVLALAFWLKLYPIALGLLLVVLYRRRFLLPLIAGLAAGFALPFVLQTPEYVYEQYGQWIAWLKIDNRARHELRLSPRDFRLLLRLCGIVISDSAYTVIQVLTGVLIAACCWLWQRRGDSERELLFRTTALSFCWMTTFGPATESATWVVLAPALVTLLATCWSRPELVRLRCSEPIQKPGLTPYSARHLLTVCYLLIPLGHVGGWPVLLAAAPLSGLILFIYLIVTGVRGRGTGQAISHRPSQPPGLVTCPSNS